MSDLLDFFKNGKSLPVLKEGKYEVTLKSAEFMENETNPNNSYIRITMEETATKREIFTNKFNGNFQIMISHLKKQLGREDEEFMVQDFLKELIDTKKAFYIWVENWTDENTGRTNINVNFLPPLQKPVTTVEEDEELI